MFLAQATNTPTSVFFKCSPIVTNLDKFSRICMTKISIVLLIVVFMFLNKRQIFDIK